jgi:alpha-beta hydrolase superfamily lysophospholipase
LHRCATRRCDILVASDMARSFLLIHGMCCTGDVWRNFRRFYETRGIRVFTPTLRPHDRVRDRPPASLQALRFADYLQDLEQEIDRIEQLTGEPVTTIGHSMGGLLAQALAERNRPNAAVSISPTAPVDARTPQMVGFWAAFTFAYGFGFTPRTIIPLRPLADFFVFNQVPTEERILHYDDLVCESGEAFADFRIHRIEEHKVKIPLLTIAAGRDRLVPPELVRLTANRYERIGGTFKEYAHHGHWLFGEPGWETVAADILDWVEAST